jgi:hypothetical protein
MPTWIPGSTVRQAQARESERNRYSDNRTQDDRCIPDAIDISLVGTVMQQDDSQTRREMRENEKDPKGVMRNKAVVPDVMHESSGRTACKRPVGIDLQECSRKYKDRIHVSDNEQREVEAGCDLKDAMEASGFC